MRFGLFISWFLSWPPYVPILLSDFVKFHHEINILKNILHKNSYPRDFVDKCVKEFVDRVLTWKVAVSTVPKKDLVIVLPYLGKL